MRNYFTITTFLIRLILILVCNSAFAQSEIVGYVISSITGLKPITEVYIEVTNSNKPVLDRMTMTDSLGSFKLENLESNKKYTLIISAFGYANQTFEIETGPGITKTTMTLEASCEYSREQAENDWKNGHAKLLLVGSIAPLANTPADKRFEREFGVAYYDFGCTPPIDECIKLYNETIFELMDNKYGKNWREKVRADVEYLK